MEKLTLEHIAPYLPYGLKVKIGDRLIKDVVFEPQRNLTTTTVINVVTGFGYKLVLRHMDLTNPIIVEGKEIIPIVELAKISYQNNDWYFNKVTKEACCRKYEGEWFTWEKDNNCFAYGNYDGLGRVENQLSLFQWLFKHKFDVLGLIEKGLAIDINTLTTNSYN